MKLLEITRLLSRLDGGNDNHGLHNRYKSNQNADQDTAERAVKDS